MGLRVSVLRPIGRVPSREDIASEVDLTRWRERDSLRACCLFIRAEGASLGMVGHRAKDVVGEVERRDGRYSYGVGSQDSPQPVAHFHNFELPACESGSDGRDSQCN
jgi:hypothetical protein